MARKSRLCSLYGFTDEFVKAQRAAGLSWCSGCEKWHNTGKRRCSECWKEINKKDYYARPEYHRERRQKHYAENREAALKYRRFYSLKSYGVTPEWYDAKLAEQNGGCAICGGTNESGRQLAIDHNHKCCDKPRGKGACDRCRRGLLCDRCNFALERLESSDTWLYEAESYLQRYGLKP